MSENGTQTTLTSVTLVVDGEAHPAAVDADGNWGITLSNLSLAPHTLVAKLAEVSSAPFSLTVTEPKPVIETGEQQMSFLSSKKDMVPIPHRKPDW
jgi:hypothetical protein